MKIDWTNAPEGATHYTIKESGAIWFKNINGFWTIYDSGVWYAIGLPASDLIPRPTSTVIPELKKLTQAVFDGLPKEYLWAAVDGYNGAACAYILEPSVMDGDDQFSVAGGDYLFVGDGYDATDWQNSLIERLSDTCIDDMGISNLQKKYQREDVPTIFEMDWAEQNQTLEAELSALRTQAIADAAEIERLKTRNLQAINLMGASVFDRSQAVQMLIDMVEFFENTPIDCGGLKNAMNGCDLLRNSKEVIKKADAALTHNAEFERIQTGHRRYEILRTLNARQFADLYAKNLETGTPFDELVDGLVDVKDGK